MENSIAPAQACREAPRQLQSLQHQAAHPIEFPPTMHDAYQSDLAARLFDLQYEGDPVLEAERRFFLDYIDDGRGETVLDLGCGTGRILIPALEAGHAAIGMDRSPAFLRRLREVAGNRGLSPRVWCADLQRPAVAGDSVALAFAAFRTFDHLIGESARRAFLEAAASFLRPGGRLLLNTANPEPMALLDAAGERLWMGRFREYGDRGRDVLWWAATRFDENSRRIEQVHSYDFVGPDGRVDEVRHFALEMEWTVPEEMERMVAEAGLRVVSVAGGFEGEPFEVGTGDAVWELERAATQGTPGRRPGQTPRFR